MYGGGAHVVCGSAAGMLASLSVDSEAAAVLLTSQPKILDALAPLRECPEIL